MADYRLFISKAPGIMGDLMRDFAFNVTQSAAILGNIGHECGGFHPRSAAGAAASGGRSGLGRGGAHLKAGRQGMDCP
jgi:hypothetical protein